MESKTKVLGHSVHQMLVHFPVGLLLASLAFDVLATVFGGAGMASAAYWMLSTGILGACLAMPFGLIDLMAIPDRTRASRIGTWHAIGNVVALSLYVSSWAVRPDSESAAPGLAVLFSVVASLTLLMTAWLGGELVSRLGVGVSLGANLNASSSLRDSP